MYLDLDCHECNSQLQIERGCHNDSKIGWEINGKMYRRCPKKLIDKISYEYLRAYNLYKHNLLPNGQSWRNESYKFLDAMMFIESEVNKIQEEAFNRKVKHKKK